MEGIRLLYVQPIEHTQMSDKRTLHPSSTTALPHRHYQWSLICLILLVARLIDTTSFVSSQSVTGSGSSPYPGTTGTAGGLQDGGNYNPVPNPSSTGGGPVNTTFGDDLPDTPPANITYPPNSCQFVTKWGGPRCPADYECVSDALARQTPDGQPHLSYRQEQCVFCAFTDYCTSKQLQDCKKLSIFSDSNTLKSLNQTKGVGECNRCREGQFCPENTNNPFGLAIVNLCPAGQYCPSPDQQFTCPVGFFCPTGIKFPLACTILGTYCAAGSTSPTELCPGGNYCPDPQTLIRCPSGYFCKTGSIAPKSCPSLASCPSGSAAALLVWQGIIFVILIYAALGLAYYLVKYYQYRRRKKELDKSEHVAEGREVAELLNRVKVFEELKKFNQHHLKHHHDHSSQDNNETETSTHGDNEKEPSTHTRDHDKEKGTIAEDEHPSSPKNNASIPPPPPSPPPPPAPPSQSTVDERTTQKVDPSSIANKSIDYDKAQRSDRELPSRPGQDYEKFTTINLTPIPPALDDHIEDKVTSSAPPPSTRPLPSKIDVHDSGRHARTTSPPAGSPQSSDSSDSSSDEGEDDDDDFSSFDPIPCPVSIEFDNLGLKLKDGKYVLQKVSGKFKAGDLVAVIGPSGCGKSSFLNVLCGKAKYGEQSGSIKLNSIETKMECMKTLTGFVPQEDTMHEDLSCYENLYYNAMLRLPRSMPHTQKLKIVDVTIKMLGLEAVQHSVVGNVEKRGISGGQRKRVNIGMEIVSWPTLLFMDEPTSGLDSTSSLEVVSAMRDLTELGVTIVTVIHQPRFSIVELFSEMLLLGRGGQTVFQGNSQQALKYFSELGFKVPEHENPADFFLDVISGEVRREGDDEFQPDDLVELWEKTGEWVRKGEEDPNQSSDDNVSTDGTRVSQQPQKQLTLLPAQQDLERAVTTPADGVASNATLQLPPPDNLHRRSQTAHSDPLTPQTQPPQRGAKAMFPYFFPVDPTVARHHRNASSQYHAMNAFKSGVTNVAQLPLPKQREILFRLGKEGIGQLVQDYEAARIAGSKWKKATDKNMKIKPPTFHTAAAASTTPVTGPTPLPKGKNSPHWMKNSPNQPHVLLTRPSSIRRLDLLFQKPSSKQQHSSQLSSGTHTRNSSTTPHTLNSTVDQKAASQHPLQGLTFGSPNFSPDQEWEPEAKENAPLTRDVANSRINPPPNVTSTIQQQPRQQQQQQQQPYPQIERSHHQIHSPLDNINEMDEDDTGSDKSSSRAGVTVAAGSTDLSKNEDSSEKRTNSGEQAQRSRSESDIECVHFVDLESGSPNARSTNKQSTKPPTTTDAAKKPFDPPVKSKHVDPSSKKKPTSPLPTQKSTEDTTKAEAKAEAKAARADAVALNMDRSSNTLPKPRDLPWMHLQFFYLFQRQCLKLMRNINDVVFDMSLTTAVGLAIGLIFGGVWTLNGYATISTMGILSLGVLSCVSALKMFGNDRVVFWREASSGISITAYWLAVTLMHLPLILILSFLFVAPYWNLILPDVPFIEVWWVFIAVFFCCSGGGMLLSVAFVPLSALLCGVMIPLIIGGFLNGVTPSLEDMGSVMKFLCSLSYSRYGVEALMIQQLGVQPDYADDIVEKVYNGIGFVPTHFQFAIGMLFSIGIVFRICTLLALHFLHRDKRS